MANPNVKTFGQHVITYNKKSTLKCVDMLWSYESYMKSVKEAGNR